MMARSEVVLEIRVRVATESMSAIACLRQLRMQKGILSAIA
jgi:hypothetical protein